MFGIFHWLLLLALLHALLRDWRKALPISLLAWIPWTPHFVGIMRGSMGELSVGTILASILLLQPRPLSEVPGVGPTAGAIVVCGVFLYGDYLAFVPTTSLHLYDAGFSNQWLVAGFALVGGWTLYKKWLWTAAGIGLALFIWNLGWFASRNVWDHLMDAPLWFLSIIYLSRNILLKRS